MLTVGDELLTLARASEYVFGKDRRLTVSGRERVEASQSRLYTLLDRKIPVYGVTTGFGDSCTRSVSVERSETLQKNLVDYLLCGTGERLSREATRATCLFRLNSLTRGYSGVSWELVERLALFLQNDWLPVIPCRGSLGASGDLIPLAYLARALQGEGEIETPEGVRAASELVEPYRLKPKEGLALVNGTSAMAGVVLVNLRHARGFVTLAETATAWLCLALRGKPDAFGALVNERAKHHPGQTASAFAIRKILADEGYRAGNEGPVQDRYSLRCAPQVLGPIRETLDQAERWLETEINGASDNPLVGDDGELAAGGNFYGGYLAHSMDYLKIGLGHIADLLDRQLTLLIDEKTNRGLPPNLANWDGLDPEERHLHHGLKGLHQAVNALTSELMALTVPNGVFSRSSESHNQDKVSLGMSAATQCGKQIDLLYPIFSMYLTCLAQALDLRRQSLSGASRALYETVRSSVPFVARDMPLDRALDALGRQLRKENHEIA